MHKVKDYTEKEQLQEALLELKRSKEREAHLYKENEAILSGLSAISDAQTKQDIFNELLDVVKKFVPFDNAIVLSSSSEVEQFTVLASTNERFNSLAWEYNDLFDRACHNESIVLFSPCDNPHFSFIPKHIQSDFESISLTGIKSHSGYAIIMLMSSTFGMYSSSTKEKMQRFIPLVERAIIDIDYKDRLHSLVNIKTKELHLSNDRFKDFAESAGDWFWETDLGFNFTYISDSTIKTIVITDRNLLTLINDNPTTSQILSSKSMVKSFDELEWWPSIFKQQVCMSISGTPYFDDAGQLIGYRGTAKDISIRKKRLQQIQKAKQEAETANKAKSQFLAMMSHEIRTPLNAILGMVDVFNESLLSKEQYEWLDQMEVSAQLLLAIISDVLDISRIEAGTFVLDEQPIDLLETIINSTNYFKEKSKDKGINLTVTVSHSVPNYVIADAARIMQIIFNLVGNAVKFTKKGSIWINITQTECNSTKIAITDTGIGISKDVLNNLFQPFVQADSSITRQFGGSGLGLSIIKRLTELMNGVISVKSVINEGSTFTVTLPFKETKECPKRITLNNNDVTDKSTRTLNILIAEDSKANQAVIQLLLEGQGHQITLVDNGCMAVEAIENKNQNFDLILMDVSMPIKDGISATKEIRAKGYNLPILALTAHAMNEEKKTCIDAGMNDFISKPVRAQELKLILDSLKLG
ncbi:response regulator, histidine kinase [Aliivibrio salmonicida LFI1238]|uniref:histidine kinase n=1 Tax=Aliivibrio salmonicida (strain LFI1238) TaxID=316275 RepID=B6ELS7_ALISL|nr:response regulator, histidine kinase [Aliivibrio salmonicida LFI1238]